MKKQIILYIIQTTVEIESFLLWIILIACSITNDYSDFWRSFLIWQTPAICIIVLATLSFHSSYMDEIEEWREKMQKFWNEFKKRDGETMKYIRTKDGRIAEVKDNMFVKQSDVLRLVYKDSPCICVLQGEDEIIAQADTPEELCDGFYNDILGEGIFNFDELYMYKDFESFKDDWNSYRIYDNWSGNGYGFIKTDKGLIYVAKMNEKGELELI